MKKTELSFRTSVIPLLLLVMFFLSTSPSHPIKASQNELTSSEISMIANKGPVVTWYNCMQNVTYGGIMPVRQCCCCCWQWFTSAANGISKCGLAVIHPDPPQD